jgi:acyl-CoA thioesterase I
VIRQFGSAATRFFAASFVFLVAALGSGTSMNAHAQASQTQAITLVALGDSLTAGYNLPASAAFPNVLEAALRERGHDVTVINAGVSGDTAAGGLARLDWSIPDDADGVIVALGANDMLRGQDPAGTKATLDEIVTRLKARDLDVLLAGMFAAPNLGAAYAERFNAIYPTLAERHDVMLYPFFLDGVAGQASLNLDDGIHPNRAGVELMVERILPTVEAFIARLARSS